MEKPYHLGRQIISSFDCIPMERYGKSEEIAATVAFLASSGAGYITGQNIRVDGGITRAV
jgi:NAD(P)-dependent dehydrogenase (short-subunit alcohol dehydrogenase family)